jgi:hypothetical protein
MKVTYEMTGMKQLQGNIERQKIRIKREATKICLAEANSIMQESLSEVPVDTGALARSAFVEQQANGDVTFGYGKEHTQTNGKTGKPTDEYMLAVHERLDVRHTTGKAKFLEDPINRHKDKLEASFARKLRRAFGL